MTKRSYSCPGWLQPLVVALQLLTRIPMPDIGLVDNQKVGWSLLFYPLVGAVIGAVLVMVQLVLQWLFVDQWLIQAAIILGLWCLITGGLHLDGLADSADAWVGGFGDRQRTLEIMKDPTCGPMAVMLLVVVLLIKFAGLSALIALSPQWLLVVPVIARAYVLLLFLTTTYVRAGGLGEVLSSHLLRNHSRNLLIVLTLVLLVIDWSMIWLILATLILFLTLRQLMLKRLGGTTGDTAGAMVELIEVVGVLALVVSASY